MPFDRKALLIKCFFYFLVGEKRKRAGVFFEAFFEGKQLVGDEIDALFSRIIHHDPLVRHPAEFGNEFPPAVAMGEQAEGNHQVQGTVCIREP